MADTLHQEIEWQFEATNLDRAKSLLARFIKTLPYRVKWQKPITQIDTYFDTEDFTFFHAGYSLRVRKKRASFEACLKSLADDAQNGVMSSRARMEIAQKISGNTIKHLLAAKGQLGAMLQRKPPESKLIPLFTLETIREKILLYSDQELVAEIALDKTTQPADPRPKSPLGLSRMEIEVKNRSFMLAVHDVVERLRRFLKHEHSPIHPAKNSKFTAAFSHNALGANLADLEDYAFNRKMPIEHYVISVVKKYLETALRDESGCRLGQDVEYVHRMRVSLRKVLSAMKLFGDYLPNKLAKRRQFLKRLVSTLGAVRDLDVEIASLSSSNDLSPNGESQGLQELVDYLIKKRDQAHRDLVKFFNGKTYARGLCALRDLLSHPKSFIHKTHSTGKIYRMLVGKRLRSFKKMGKKIVLESRPQRFHDLRIKGKELRYALEFFRPIHEKHIVKIIEILSAIQDKLGAINDCGVAKVRLLDIVKKKSARFSPTAIFKIGQASMYYVVAEKQNRKEFIECFHEIDWRLVMKGI